MSALNITVEPLATNENYKLCQRAAAEDQHEVGFTDHVVTKNDEIIGTFGTIPLVLWWMHTKKATKLDSLMMFNAVDTLQRENENLPYFILCEPDSPYFKLMQKHFSEYVLENNQKPAIFIKR
jgi:hypothetical protein